MRLGAFGVVGAQVDVDESPVEPVGDLRAEAVDVVVVAVDADDARAVDGGAEDLGLLEIGGDEDVGFEPGCGGLAATALARLPVEEQPTVSKPKRRASARAMATTRSLKESVGK